MSEEQRTCENCKYVRITVEEYRKTTDDITHYYCEREMPRREVEKDGYCKWSA